MKNIINWRPEFTSILLFNDVLMPTHFDLTIKMNIISDIHAERDIALERIQAIVESFFDGSLICEMNEFASELPYSFSNNVVAIPTEPTDHMLCCLLFTKCNAVAEGRISIEEISIISSRGSGLEYFVSNTQPLPSFLQSSSTVLPWFLRNDASFTDSFQTEDKNVIHFPIEYCTWEEINLNWDRSIEKTETENTDIIDFKSIITKNEDQ
jgi:hypothetical protein